MTHIPRKPNTAGTSAIRLSLGLFLMFMAGALVAGAAGPGPARPRPGPPPAQTYDQSLAACVEDKAALQGKIDRLMSVAPWQRGTYQLQPDGSRTWIPIP